MKKIDNILLYIPFFGIVYSYFFMKKPYMKNDGKINILPQMLVQSLCVWGLIIYLYTIIFVR